MKNKTRSACMLLRAFLCVLAFQSACCLAGQYTNFNAAIYIPVGVVRSFENAETLSNNWQRISSQLKVDKVYIEV